MALLPISAGRTRQDPETLQLYSSEKVPAAQRVLWGALSSCPAALTRSRHEDLPWGSAQAGKDLEPQRSSKGLDPLSSLTPPEHTTEPPRACKTRASALACPPFCLKGLSWAPGAHFQLPASLTLKQNHSPVPLPRA